MSIIYTWKVKGIKTTDVGDITNFVVQTYWEKIGTTSDGETAAFQGATPFDTSVMDPSSIVPFDQLTEEVVLGWIQSVVVGSYEEHVNRSIEENIQKNKIKEVKLPWSPEDSSVTPTPPKS